MAPASDTSATPAAAPTVSLQSLLDELGSRTGRRFLVDRQAPAQLRLGTVPVSGLTYPLLLTVLRNNGLAAVTVDGVVIGALQ